jgi:pimeloyl-ACP methyl ester carboxylesterase
LAAKHNVIVLVPRPVDATKWEATELEFVGKASDDVARNYAVDKERVAVLGEQAGGTLGWLWLAQQPERLRGLAVVGANPPPNFQLPDNQPTHRLAFWIGAGKGGPATAAKAVANNLGKARFPATFRELTAAEGKMGPPPTPDAELFRWLETLDRL